MDINRGRIILIIVICFLVINCSNRKRSTKESLEKNQITLIFKSTPPASHSNLTGGLVATEIEFIDDNYIQQHFFPDQTKRFDTLVFKTKRKLVEFRHYYKTVDKLSYLFQNGDTVMFRYQNNTPVATVLNRKTKAYDVNFDLFKRETLTPYDYPAFVKFELPMVFADYSNGFEGVDKKVFSLAIERFPFELNQEKRLLDSLQQNNLISDDMSNFFKTRSLYQQKIIQLQEILGFYSIRPLYQKLRPVDFIIQLGYDRELGWLNSGNILDNKNDSLIYFGFYYDVINWFNYNYLSRKVGRVKSTNYINNISTAGSNLADYMSLADTINENKLLSTHAKNILRFENIQSIIENNSIDEANKAFEKFEKEVKDTALVNFVRSKYLLNESSKYKTNDLHLVSTNSERISFDKLIKKHRGNVLYIDFWGSYCPPCISQFKFSVGLKQSYQGKKLVQIYISAEPDKKMWLTACKKYNLETESYFVDNRYTSRQLEDMNIKYFPNYKIYDKQGKLVNEFAPRPSEKELISLIDDCLAKE
jgi:thiol-disulfide isomerase/thioredoxin